jgi:hypothetical protein
MRRYFEAFPKSLPKGTVAVTVYIDYRNYGGPEEGGWYYTDPRIVEVAVFRSMRKARKFLKGLVLRKHYRAYLEFPGADPIEQDSDGMPFRTRPYELRPVYRHRELLFTPHYC